MFNFMAIRSCLLELANLQYFQCLENIFVGLARAKQFRRCVMEFCHSNRILEKLCIGLNWDLKSCGAAAPEWVRASSWSSDTERAAPVGGPGPGTRSREYCRGRARCWETSFVTLSFCCLIPVHRKLRPECVCITERRLCEARALDDNWDTERDGVRAGAATSLRHERHGSGVLNMSNITDMKLNDWQAITLNDWHKLGSLMFGVYCKVAWRIIWRLMDFKVCQDYCPSFLSKVLGLHSEMHQRNSNRTW